MRVALVQHQAEYVQLYSMYTYKMKILSVRYKSYNKLIITDLPYIISLLKLSDNAYCIYTYKDII